MSGHRLLRFCHLMVTDCLLVSRKDTFHTVKRSNIQKLIVKKEWFVEMIKDALFYFCNPIALTQFAILMLCVFLFWDFFLVIHLISNFSIYLCSFCTIERILLKRMRVPSPHNSQCCKLKTIVFLFSLPFSQSRLFNYNLFLHFLLFYLPYFFHRVVFLMVSFLPFITNWLQLSEKKNDLWKLHNI